MLSRDADRPCDFFYKEGKLVARAKRGDRNGYCEFEIVKFEAIGPGLAYEGLPT